jgi:hypothetical protein
VPRTSIRIDADPDAVFDVLDDAYAYPRWVVGARRIRGIDATWPAVGSSFRHAIGAPGAELRDASTVTERKRPELMALRVCFRPTGVANVTIRVEPAAGQSNVTLEEEVISGPAARLPKAIVGPLLALRNVLSLQRLRHEVERRR